MEITCDIVGKPHQATTTNSFTTIRRTHHENLDATTTKQRTLSDADFA
ncbi:hypothetical protein HMPREF1980_01547, partial [Actinomyces sp. oral taxon 172 str. F0311]